MAGIAATLDGSLDALSAALAVRGPNALTHRIGPVGLLSRAAIPSVPVYGSVALVTDGIVEPTTLVARYRELGPAGLVTGTEPGYALILADARTGGLVLARNGDGPPLHYTNGLAASEPAALHAAGVPVAPDWAVVDRFLATGVCDDTEATFFAGISRVMPNEVVEITPAGTRRIGAPFYRRVAPHPAQPLDLVDEIDVDAFLADVGEPVPDLAGYLLWAAAHRVAGEPDAQIDVAGTSPWLARIADRVASRYGVTVRFPCLPAGADGPDPTEVLRQVRVPLAATLLHPRLPDGRTGLAQLAALAAGQRVDAGAVLRRYTVERWLRTTAPARPDEPVAPRRTVTVAGTPWARYPVPTEVLAPGDRIVEKVAWYVAERVTTAPPTDPWYVLVAARAVAVAQGQAREVWDIRPGRYARLLSRLCRGTSLASPWAMQVAVEVGGPVRMLVASLCHRAGRPGWAARVAGPQVGAIRGPRADAVAPGPVAVTAPPAEPDRVAAETLEALPGAAGCAIVAVTGAECRVLGWAGAVESPPLELIRALCADNPFGPGGQRTPIVLALPARRYEPRPGGKASNQARTARSYARPNSKVARLNSSPASSPARASS